MAVELYLDLYSQPCRSVYIFAKKNNIPFEFKQLSLMNGELTVEETEKKVQEAFILKGRRRPFIRKVVGSIPGAFKCLAYRNLMFSIKALISDQRSWDSLLFFIFLEH